MGNPIKKTIRVQRRNKEEESPGSSGNFRKDERGTSEETEIGKNSTETAK